MTKQGNGIFQLLVAAGMMMAAASILAADDFPGAEPDRRIIKLQEKVDALFEKGDFERAYFIYKEELVPLGDKYAQYMVGYMTLVGKGVPQDVIGGSAWYQLAAERGNPAFVQARDEVLRLFDEERRILSDQRYYELRRDFSDAMIVAKLAEKALRTLGGTIEASDWARTLNDSQYVSRRTLARDNAEALSRLEQLRNYLVQATATPGLLTAEESERISGIERRASDLLRTYRSEE